MKKTKFFNKAERNWVIVDAKDKVLGRLAVAVAKLLMGKTKAVFTPNMLTGDKVIVINANHIKVTGRKTDDKVYDKYTGFQSGRKEMIYKKMKKVNPCEIFRMAVKGMLPKSHLGREMLRSLRVYPEAQHEQIAQVPGTRERQAPPSPL